MKRLLLKVTPRFAVRWFASPYIAGETREDALAVADTLFSRYAIHSTIDLLGEYITTRDMVMAEVTEYRALVAQLGNRPHVRVSVKLSALGQSIDETWCYENAENLVRQADEAGVFVRFDMEDRTTVDSTLRIYRQLREKGFERIGIVLQSRLFRTPTDIEKLADLVPNVRICIGIYQEPPETAVTDRPMMKVRLLDQLKRLLELGCYVGIATHDEPTIARSREMIETMKIPQNRVEFQMLLGVPRAVLQQELVAAGYLVRIYVPYGQQWYPYSVRRLLENPDIVGHVVRNFFSGQTRLKRG